MNMIPGKTASVARVFQAFLSSEHYNTIDVGTFIIFLLVFVSMYCPLLQNWDKHQNGTLTGQEAKKRDCPGQNGTLGNYELGIS